MTAYTLGDAARICGVSRRRLRYWERTALVPARGASEIQPAFDFRALVSVRSIVDLLARGVPLCRIRRNVEAVRERLPDLEPLAALQLWNGSARFVVRHEGVLMEPQGQLVLDLGDAASNARIAPFARDEADRNAVVTGRFAVEWFERGCECDGDPETYADAVAAYQKAISAAPDFADAHCNLGSVYFNQDRRKQARACFERALAIDAKHLEANLNLGTVLEEEGRDELALRHYRKALEADPLYSDVHVSLALLYEKLTLPRTAVSHWRRYLQLAPHGAWAEVARGRVSAS